MKIAVRDTGIGISEEQFDQIFDRFAQADSSTTRRYGGTGLGLPISRSLAKLMGGDVHGTSEPGSGSTFWLDIPVTPTSGDRSDESPTDLHGNRILVVSPCPPLSQSALQLVEERGGIGSAAQDLDQALALIGKADSEGAPFSVLLIDDSLPASTAKTLAEPRRHGPGAQATPCIILRSLSGSEDIADRPEYTGALTKPLVRESGDDLARLLSPTATAAPQVTSETTQDVGNPPGRRVLIVDDDPVNRMVVTHMVDLWGWDNVAVESGFEALALLETERFDLIFMDCQMPGMDGLETTRRIRGNADCGDTTIVALTAHAMLGDRELYLAAGVNDYLTKPVTVETIDGALRKWGPDIAAEHARESSTDQDSEALRGGRWRGSPMNQVLALARTGGDERLVREVASTFLEAWPEHRARLEPALASGDLATLRQIAHRIKGGAATIAAEIVQGIAANLEAAAVAGDTASVGAEVAALVEAMQLLGAHVDEAFATGAMSWRTPPAS